jgi:hypothetical protein
MKRALVALFVTVIVIISGSPTSGRTPMIANERSRQTTASALPAYCLASHDIGRLQLGITNNGTLGPLFSLSGTLDCFTGLPVANASYPVGSDTWYLFGGALWIGAVKGVDTLVSVGQDGWQAYVDEFHPDEIPAGRIVYRSIADSTSPAYDDAVAEQEYIAVYTDTFTSGVQGLVDDYIDGRPHIPLGVEVTQHSMAWSYLPVEDFILFGYTIKNIGLEPLDDLYLGWYVDADVHHDLFQANGARDDLTGFLSSAPAFYMPEGCPDIDALNLAWIADNNGDLDSPFPGLFVPHVTGMSLIASSNPSAMISYNWWLGNSNPVIDYGPQTDTTYRDYGTGGTGTPEGDRNKYHILRNGEIDYDQAYTAQICQDSGYWKPAPPSMCWEYSYGSDTKYVISIGPFDVASGEQISVALAYVAGENLHTDAANIANLNEGSYDPDAYYSNLDFSDFTKNAIIAGWVYDNPGVDTDSDGYRGEYHECDGEKYYYTGDGVPDYRASTPPPAPEVRAEALSGAIRLQWNGAVAETARDIISRRQDFEGYRVYLTSNPTPANMAMVAAYDRENFYKYTWNPVLGKFRMRDYPFSLHELRCLYADNCLDSTWHPLDYPAGSPFFHPPDSIFYFAPVGCNQMNYGWDTPIIKRFSDAPEPDPEWLDDTTLIPPAERDLYLTPEGYFKFYEYEYVATDLVPGQSYWVAVTAYDHGTLLSTTPVDESDIADGLVQATPAAGPAYCCQGLAGNVDNDPANTVDIGDLTTLIDYLYISEAPLECREEANVDGSLDGIVDIADLTHLIDFLYLNHTSPAICR